MTLWYLYPVFLCISHIKIEKVSDIINICLCSYWLTGYLMLNLMPYMIHVYDIFKVLYMKTARSDSLKSDNINQYMS